jgi:hypothetical protein
MDRSHKRHGCESDADAGAITPYHGRSDCGMELDRVQCAAKYMSGTNHKYSGGRVRGVMCEPGQEHARNRHPAVPKEHR